MLNLVYQGVSFEEILQTLTIKDDVDKQDAEQVRAFFWGEAQGADNLLRSYVTLAKGVNSYSDSAWDKIERTLIFNRVESQ